MLLHEGRLWYVVPGVPETSGAGWLLGDESGQVSGSVGGVVVVVQQHHERPRGWKERLKNRNNVTFPRSRLKEDRRRGHGS